MVIAKVLLHLGAGAHAAAADDTLCRIEQEIGVGRINFSVEVITALAVSIVDDAFCLQRLMKLAPTALDTRSAENR